MYFKIIESTTSQLDYITSYRSNLEKFKIEVENLMGIKSSVQEKVDEAKRNREKILNNVHIWLKKLDATIVKAENLILNDVQANYPIHIPNMQFMHQHSKKLQMMIQEIHQVLEKETSIKFLKHQ